MSNIICGLIEGLNFNFVEPEKHKSTFTVLGSGPLDDVILCSRKYFLENINQIIMMAKRQEEEKPSNEDYNARMKSLGGKYLLP